MGSWGLSGGEGERGRGLQGRKQINFKTKPQLLETGLNKCPPLNLKGVIFSTGIWPYLVSLRSTFSPYNETTIFSFRLY